MKLKIIFCAALCLACLAASCGEKPNTENEDKVDVTLDKKEPSDVEAAYTTFYKPAGGETGDPMPYWNEEDNMFYVYYLLESHSGQKGGIYLTKTKDFATFTNISTAAILIGNKGERDEGIGTGTCIKKDNTYHFFYTGFSDGAMWGNYRQVAVKAISTTPDFKNHQKILQPQIQAPQDFLAGEFRDPNVYWDDTRNKYVLAVGSIITGSGRTRSAIARFQSDDLSSWERIQEIKSTLSNEPQEYEITTDSDIPECPDIFKMGGRWYCVFSRINRDWHRKTYYRVADNPNGPWRIPVDENGAVHQTLDGLYLYAAKTVSNGGNSASSGNGTARYICGWASSGQKFNSGNELDWGGMLITHKLVQQPSGVLYPTIPDGLNTKFATTAQFKDIVKNGAANGSGGDFILGDGSNVVFSRNAASCKIEMKIDASNSSVSSFGVAFGAYENQQDAYKISFDLTSNNEFGLPSLFMHQKGEMLNFTPLITPADKQFNVKIVIEKQVCVMYINDNVAFTNHITNLERNPWMIFADNGNVRFYDIKVYKQ